MKKLIKDKLVILNETGMIDLTIKDFCCTVIDRLNNDGYSAESYDMLITHLAMALERAKKEEEIGELIFEVWSQITSHPLYQVSITYCNELCKDAPYQLTNMEMRYLIMHVCNLIKEETK